MYHFFVKTRNVGEETVIIQGKDVNHIKNVLRMKVSEEVTVSDEEGQEYYCKISDIQDTQVILEIVKKKEEGHELPVELYLFQGLSKGDKMDTIIQKAVELGVHAVIPVETKRCVVKLDEKKKDNKEKRWNAIAESAAKQSKRTIIPRVMPVMKLQDAYELAQELDYSVIPYEHAHGMASLKKSIEKMQPGMKIGIFIGPEGGFEEDEITMAVEKNIVIVSLGKRILRTETAGMALLSMMMLTLEMVSGSQ